MFDFPTYQKLIQEQKRTLMDDHPKKFVIGPPGSGKTVLALFMAKELPQDEKIKYLVYNNTLNDYISFAINNNQEIKSIASNTTWHSWLKEFYKNITHQEPPLLNGEPFVYDWHQVRINLMRNHSSVKAMKHLIVDEGQDMPKEFYEFVAYISENYTVFADENQILGTHKSTFDDIRAGLCDGFKEYKLTKNHRNTHEIAVLAENFYTGLTSGIPERPPKERSGIKPVCFRRDESEQIKFIVNYCNQHPNSSIGIFVPEPLMVKKKYKELKSTAFKTRVDYYYNDKYNDCPKCIDGSLVPRKSSYGSFYGCSRYRSDGKGCDFKRGKKWPPQQMNYSMNSVIVLNYSVIKGLEFDTVIVPFMKNSFHTALNDKNKMNFYVMVTRAKKELFFLKQDQYVPIIDDIPNINNFIDFK